MADTFPVERDVRIAFFVGGSKESMRKKLSEVLQQPTIQMGPTGSHIPLVVQLESDPQDDPLRGNHWLRCKATEIHDEVEQLDAEEVRQRKVSGLALFRVWLKIGSIVENTPGVGLRSSLLGLSPRYVNAIRGQAQESLSVKELVWGQIRTSATGRLV